MDRFIRALIHWQAVDPQAPARTLTVDQVRRRDAEGAANTRRDASAAPAAEWAADSFPGRAHVIAGDSAGAGLAVGVALHERDHRNVEFSAQLLVSAGVAREHLEGSGLVHGYLLLAGAPAPRSPRPGGTRRPRREGPPEPVPTGGARSVFEVAGERRRREPPPAELPPVHDGLTRRSLL
ncbi:alpha/beta hydrolase fold domain-containing protein [Streptomyces rubiginosohelvolus]|uniref:alpha/beta hydrolase fold domain-containing protein n=1 Tax=Streptomyces rubiginosohelvolus TaxID=67362 RepID=UPI00368D978E